MVKAVWSVSRRGLRDWLIQRISAFYMACFSLVVLAYLGMNPELSFAEWHTLFSQNWMKIVSILFLINLLFHAWIGVWTIYSDYVKPPIIRGLLDVVTLFLLAACFIWGIMILWSV